MADRQIDPRLQELYDLNVPVYSISRLDCINRCLYEAKLTYMDKIKGRENIYALLGTRIHDVLEKLMRDEAKESDLLPAMQSELSDCDLFGYEFPKDSRGEDTIRNSWISDMTHFCEHYERPKGKFTTESFFLYKTPKGRYLQGYIDLTKIRTDGKLSVFDYKTSTSYKGEGLKEHGRQLVLYALGLEQQGYVVNSIAWIFLKYVEVRFVGRKTPKSKEKTPLIKVMERRKIAQELERHVRDDLAEIGLDDLFIEDTIDTMLQNNELPKAVQERYKIIPYVCKYDLTDETRRECIEYIDATIDKWENLTDYPPKKFTQTTRSGKERPDTFYCTQLCGHGDKCPYIKEYLETYMGDDDEDNLFA